MKLQDIKPANYNPRLDLQEGDPEYEKLKRSIKEFGIVEPLVINERTGNLVGGHQRLKVLKDLGFDEVDVSIVNLNDEKEKMLNIALNKISGDWDSELLKDLLMELDTGEYDIELTGFDHEELENMMTEFYVDEDESDYTDKIVAPVYEPKEHESPEIHELYDEEKSLELIEKIKKSDVPEEIKDFLKIASYRHIVFDYARIAEYYAHADKDVQELMEDSALVIIDFDDAIKNGFIEFTRDVIDSIDSGDVENDI